jgi:hypothetical protein
MVHEGRMIFSQFLELISWNRFQTCVDHHRGDWHVKSFYCCEFFRVMIFAQITGRSSLVCDQKVRLTGTGMNKKYPELIRRIKYIDPETGKRLVFLTNNMTVSAETIALLYKNRWHVELFFKWIKQHLHIKSFYGRSDNAVRSQLWISVCVYLMIAILKKRLALPQTLNEVLHILSVTPFEKMPISSVFFGKNTQIQTCTNPNQLLLFDL